MTTKCCSQIPANVFRVLTYNIQCGIGQDRQYAPKRISNFLSEIKDLSVIALQEADRHDKIYQSTRMGVKHGDDHPKIIAAAMGWTNLSQRYFAVKKLMKKKENDCGWIDAEPTKTDEHGWGCALLTRSVREKERKVPIPAQNSLTKSRLGHQYVSVKLDNPVFGRIWIFSVHFMADEGGLATCDLFGSLQLQNLQALLEHIETHVHEDECDSVIIMGDFNSLSCSRVVQSLLRTKGKWGPYIDCASACSNNNATHEWYLRIDYVFLSSRSKIEPVRSRIHRVPYSDHYPLLCDFQVSEGRNRTQQLYLAEKQLYRARCQYFAFICALIILSPILLIFLTAYVLIRRCRSLKTLVCSKSHSEEKSKKK